MFRRLPALLVPALLLALFLPSPLWADEGVLDVIPDDALGFVVVNRLAATDETIQAAGQRMQLPVPSLFSALKARSGIHEGLNEQGSAALVALPGEGDDALPVVLLYLPVSDFGKLVGQLGAKDVEAPIVEVRAMNAPFLAARHGDYAVFAEPKSRAALEKALNAPAGEIAELKPMHDWLLKGNVGAAITTAGVKLGCKKGQQGIAELREHLGQVPEDMQEQMKAAMAVFGVYDTILGWLGKEVTAYGVSARFDEAGTLYLADWMQCTPGGDAAAAIARIGKPEGDVLAGLPQQPFVVAGGGILTQELLGGLTDWSMQIIKAAPQLYHLDAAQVDQLMKVSRQSMAGMQGMSMMLAVGKPGDPIYSNLAGVLTVDGTGRYLADYRKTLEETNALLQGTKSPIIPKTEVSTVTIDGVTALQMEMSYPVIPNAEQIPNYQEMMEKLFGTGGKMRAWMAPADEHHLVVSYTSQALLKQGLEVFQQHTPGLAGEKSVSQVAGLLLPEAQWVVYLSPKGTVDFINRVIPTFDPSAGNDFPLPEFPATPAIGWAGKTVPDGMRSALVVPAPVLTAIGRYVAEVQAKVAQQKQAEAQEPEEKP